MLLAYPLPFVPLLLLFFFFLPALKRVVEGRQC